MGQLHNELKTGPFGRALKKVLGVSDHDGGLERYGETLTPVLDMWALPEFEFHRGERGYARSLTSPAVVGRVSALGLTNPLGSNALAVVNLIRNTGALGIQVVTDVTTFASIAANVVTATVKPLEMRPVPAFPVTQLLFQQGDTVAGAAQPNYLLDALGATGHADEIDPRIVLAPGTVLFLFGAAVNAAIVADVRWRERRVSGDELV